jgi:ribosomal protein L11 methyltransferase
VDYYKDEIMRENYQPFNIGEQFIIVPLDSPETGIMKHSLVMERGAFGSGEHETTRSCIELLEQLPDADNRKILDLGSGTGILTIAALLLNPDSRAICVDIDPVAVDSCQNNCSLNNITQRVQHVCGTLDQVDDKNYDLILANIYGDILLNIADDLVKKARQNSYILLSGILWEYNFEVKKKYQDLGCDLIRSRLLDEFCTVLLKKR